MGLYVTRAAQRENARPLVSSSLGQSDCSRIRGAIETFARWPKLTGELIYFANYLLLLVAEAQENAGAEKRETENI